MEKSNEELQAELAELKAKYSTLNEKYIAETQKLTEEIEELKYNLMFLEGVSNSTYDGFLVVNPYGKKILQNQRTVELWKIPKEIVDDPDGMKQVEHVMHMTVDPKQFVSEIDYLRDHPNERSKDELALKDGTILERYSAPVIGNDTKNYGRIWTFHDITERKEIEKQLIKLNSDKDRFISILTHDLRNPFNTLLGFSTLLKKNIETYSIEKTKLMVDAIHKASENTLSLLEDTLVWANLKSKKINFTPVAVTIGELINDVIDTLSHGAGLKNITLINNADKDIEAYADVYMIKAILRNLVSNAIKFTNQGGEISISTTRKPNSVELIVADNGIGIESERISGMFKFSANKSTAGTNNEEGTGLGLLLCKEFIEQHQGEIWLESEQNKGTKVFFTLPDK